MASVYGFEGRRGFQRKHVTSVKMKWDPGTEWESEISNPHPKCRKPTAQASEFPRTAPISSALSPSVAKPAQASGIEGRVKGISKLAPGFWEPHKTLPRTVSVLIWELWPHHQGQ